MAAGAVCQQPHDKSLSLTDYSMLTKNSLKDEIWHVVIHEIWHVVIHFWDNHNFFPFISKKKK